MPEKLTKVLGEAYEQAVEDAGYPDSPAELDRIWRSVNRHPSETVTEGTDHVRDDEEASD